jgi:hypothetical protein
VHLLKKILKITLTSVCLFIVGFTLYINIKLHDQPEIRESQGKPINITQIKHLRYIATEIERGAALDMQQVYPEGFVFTHALHALAWCDVADRLDQSSPLRLEAIERIASSLAAINSQTGQAPFDPSLPLSYGAFYRGWSNYLLGRKIALQNDSTESVIFKKNCDDIAQSISLTLYPSSYSDMSWPADVVICVASLAYHDKLFQPKYTATINSWISRVKKTMGAEGLIAHSSDNTGITREGPRGSSQSLMLAFLNDIDSSFADGQFKLYQKEFIDQHLGLSFIREYPKGDDNKRGDIDSGPVWWDIGPAATLVGQRTLATYGDSSHAASIAACIEAFGMARTSAEHKNYLFGKLIIADVFIAWANGKHEGKLSSHDTSWRTNFHLYSGCLLLLLIIVMAFLWRKR